VGIVPTSSTLEQRLPTPFDAIRPLEPREPLAKRLKTEFSQEGGLFDPLSALSVLAGVSTKCNPA
jgi:hypothetical protein